jgi:hypothetical protein
MYDPSAPMQAIKADALPAPRDWDSHNVSGDMTWHITSPFLAVSRRLMLHFVQIKDEMGCDPLNHPVELRKYVTT